MSSFVTRRSPGDTSWFTADRFGMFIHWGLYSMPARHEWVKNYEKLSEAQYEKYFEYFDPDLYDAREWAKKAKAAGMKYAILTTKHHEGFCMFDSQYTDYKCTNTKAGRDLVKEFVEAFRAEGLRVGFYYSLLDWHHPDFTIDYYHPRRDEPNVDELNKGRDLKRYAQYMRDQVTELMTNYGKIDILWFDFSYPDDPSFPEAIRKGKSKEVWESEKLIEIARTLQPGIIINNRAGIDQDIWTPEQYQIEKWLTHAETGEKVVWEACHTFSGSWGYYRDEQTWKSERMLIDLLINSVSLGGNLLMNVGPTSRGYFDSRAEKALDVYAKWMKYNSRSIYNCTMAEPQFTAPRGCRLTQSSDGKRLYVHLMEYPYGFLEMHGYAGKVAYAQFLHDGSELQMCEGKPVHISDGLSKGDDLLFLTLPAIKPDVTVPVIELFLK